MHTEKPDSRQGIAPVREKPPVPKRESVRPERSFAERLAEAVHAADLVEAANPVGARQALMSVARQEGLMRGWGSPMSGGWWVELGEGRSEEARRKKRRSGGRQGI